MRECGKMTYSMAKEKKLGPTGLFMKEIIRQEKSTVLVYTVGTMVRDMRENGRKIK